jgi:hypothetical protein
MPICPRRCSAAVRTSSVDEDVDRTFVFVDQVGVSVVESPGDLSQLFSAAAATPEALLQLEKKKKKNFFLQASVALGRESLVVQTSAPLPFTVAVNTPLLVHSKEILQSSIPTAASVATRNVGVPVPVAQDGDTQHASQDRDRDRLERVRRDAATRKNANAAPPGRVVHVGLEFAGFTIVVEEEGRSASVVAVAVAAAPLLSFTFHGLNVALEKAHLQAKVEMLVRDLELVYLPTQQRILWSPPPPPATPTLVEKKTRLSDDTKQQTNTLFRSTVSRVDTEDEHTPSHIHVSSDFYHVELVHSADVMREILGWVEDLTARLSSSSSSNDTVNQKPSVKMVDTEAIQESSGHPPVKPTPAVVKPPASVELDFRLSGICCKMLVPGTRTYINVDIADGHASMTTSSTVQSVALSVNFECKREEQASDRSQAKTHLFQIVKPVQVVILVCFIYLLLLLSLPIRYVCIYICIIYIYSQSTLY